MFCLVHASYVLAFFALNSDGKCEPCHQCLDVPYTCFVLMLFLMAEVLFGKVGALSGVRKGYKKATP